MEWPAHPPLEVGGGVSRCVEVRIRPCIHEMDLTILYKL